MDFLQDMHPREVEEEDRMCVLTGCQLVAMQVAYLLNKYDLW